MLANFHFIRIGPPLNAQAISNFEQEIGGSLDDDHKEFLLKINGGLARPKLRSTNPDLQYQISTFFGIESGYQQLRAAYFDLQESMDQCAPKREKLVPIAFDQGDGAICTILGESQSAVVYVPTVNHLAEDDIEFEAIKVAKSFQQFVDSLSQ